MQKRSLKLGYLLLAIFGVYFLFASGKVLYAIYMSEKTVFNHEEVVLGEGPVLRYISAGDSITYGTGASDIKNTFPYQVAEKLSANYTVYHVNIAKVGAKTNQLLENQVDRIIAYDPDIITITITGNDLMRLRPNEKTLLYYQNILSRLVEKTDAQIYITGTPDFSGVKVLPELYLSLIQMRSERLNEAIFSLEIDPTRIHIIDVQNRHLEIQAIGGEIVAKDGLHANDLGYTIWRDVFLGEINKLFPVL